MNVTNQIWAWFKGSSIYLYKITIFCNGEFNERSLNNSHSRMIVWAFVITFSALLALCEGNPLVTVGFPSRRPVTLGFDVFFDLCLNSRLSNRDTGDLRRHRTPYDVIIMTLGWYRQFELLRYRLQGPICYAYPILWLLMSWWRKETGHIYSYIDLVLTQYCCFNTINVKWKPL